LSAPEVMTMAEQKSVQLATEDRARMRRLSEVASPL
jgi:hypothetical protein